MLYTILYTELSVVSMLKTRGEKARNKNAGRNEEIQYGRMKPVRHFSSIRTNFSLRNNTCRSSKSPLRQTTVSFKAFSLFQWLSVQNTRSKIKTGMFAPTSTETSAANRIIRVRISYGGREIARQITKTLEHVSLIPRLVSRLFLCLFGKTKRLERFWRLQLLDRVILLFHCSIVASYRTVINNVLTNFFAWQILARIYSCLYGTRVRVYRHTCTVACENFVGTLIAENFHSCICVCVRYVKHFEILITLILLIPRFQVDVNVSVEDAR